MRHYLWLPVALSLLAIICSQVGINNVPAGESGSRIDPASKIAFDLNQFNAQGLYGPPDGLRALAYEFCLPADPALSLEVRAIDPTIVIYPGSKGRVVCAPGEHLCIGSTQQPQFKAVLLKLASLPYIKQIKPCFFE
jgi:hypothetical protein